MPSRTIRWTKHWKGAPEVVTADAAVWVSVAKIEESWRRDSFYYLSRADARRSERWWKFELWLMEHDGEPVWMPHLRLDDEGHLAFTDGRHRFAWMRDHSATALPVSTDPEQADEIARRFGTRSRTTKVRSPR
jgi:hypothetical protein